jgi:hypothetical protein
VPPRRTPQPAYIAVIVLLITVAALTGVLVAQLHAQTSASGVSSFNDGFADSKADDCQQGFAPACSWLDTN